MYLVVLYFWFVGCTYIKKNRWTYVYIEPFKATIFALGPWNIIEDRLMLTLVQCLYCEGLELTHIMMYTVDNG